MSESTIEADDKASIKLADHAYLSRHVNISLNQSIASKLSTELMNQQLLDRDMPNVLLVASVTFEMPRQTRNVLLLWVSFTRQLIA